MMDCHEILDRLYDEDCRRALATGAVLPADAASHVAACGECRSLCDELREDAVALPAELSEDVARARQIALIAALADAYPPAPLLDWRSAAVWAVGGGSLAACAVALAGANLAHPWGALVVLAASTLAMATDLTRQGLEAA